MKNIARRHEGILDPRILSKTHTGICLSGLDIAMLGGISFSEVFNTSFYSYLYSYYYL